MADLRQIIAEIGELKTLPERVTRDFAAALTAELRANVAAGVGPDGTPWKPTKSGEKPLRDAMRGVDIRVIRGSVIAQLDALHSRHHFGRVTGGVRRPILPKPGEIPARLAARLKAEVDRAFARFAESR